MTGRFTYTYRWWDDPRRKIRVPRWWRIVCRHCDDWTSGEVDRFTGPRRNPTGPSKAAVAAFERHFDVHR